MSTREKISFCRICSGGCGVRLTVDERDQIIAIRGDRASPLTAGYVCFKGLQAAESHHGPARLLRPLKRQPGGSFEEIGSEQALDEIAEILRRLIDRNGPKSVAVFLGNGGMFNIPGYFIHHGFLEALGSDQYFSTLTIDQSAKYVSFGRLGGWAAGYPDFNKMEVALLFGANPLLSHGSLGFLQVDPVRKLKQARARGLKLIVVDPRRTETARNADLALQPYPGQDAAIAGGIIRLILEEGWHDYEFCENYVAAASLETLRRAVDPLSPEFVERRAGLEPGQIRAAAQLFARDSKVGSVTVATGPSMSPFSNLAQHLADCINVICGRFLRAGETVHRINALGPQASVHAEVVPPLRAWQTAGASRIRGARLIYGERPSGTLTDEILTPGEDQIRALLLDGGDPMTSFPGQRKTAEAMAALDLLVSIDPWRTPTTKFAHYILPPYMQYERADLPMNLAGYACWPGGWAQYTAPAIRPPEGADLVHDWYVFWSIAKKLGRTIVYNGTTPLDMELVPTCDDLIQFIMRDAPITLAELKRHPSGVDIYDGEQIVQPARPDAIGKFDLMPHDVAGELARFLAIENHPGRHERDGKTFSHLMATRRMRDLFNSNGRYLRTVRNRTPYNPAYLHPSDLASLGITSGDRIELESAYGRTIAIAAADETVKPGIVSLAHGWGGLPGSNQDPAETGTAVNALIDTDCHYESVNAMPHMSAVPVNISRLKHDRSELRDDGVPERKEAVLC
jgi:anaerobic selenocysteine-containing dehydrogenase